jgi:hypothetical protein
MNHEPESDTLETFADKMVSQSYEFTIQHAMDRIEKAERERDEARQLAETFRDAWKSDHRGAFFVGTTLPWEK